MTDQKETDLTVTARKRAETTHEVFRGSAAGVFILNLAHAQKKRPLKRRARYKSRANFEIKPLVLSRHTLLFNSSFLPTELEH